MRDESKAAVVGTLLLVLLALVVFIHPDRPLFRWRPTPPPSAEAPDDPFPPGRFDDFIARYGPPTFEEQTDKGVLHPPLFTKWLDYEPEHLRVAFVAADVPGEVPGSAPGDAHSRSWVLIAFLDSSKPEPISAREAAQRLRTRGGNRTFSSSR